MTEVPEWLAREREHQPYSRQDMFFAQATENHLPAFLNNFEFNRHSINDGTHVSPFDEARIDIGLEELKVKLIQGVDEEAFKRVLSRSLRATTGIHPEEPDTGRDWEEMMKGGLQSALETQVIVFEVTGASRVLTHQLVRTRKASFHQQSQRATWYGDRPNARWPESITQDMTGEVAAAWEKAQRACWDAYKAACDADISYQDARYILPEGTTNYILCEYTVREFINVFAYRGCSGFLWEMVGAMREMRRLLIEAHPFLEPYVKISCEKGALCSVCEGSGAIWSNGNPMTLAERRLWEAKWRMAETEQGQKLIASHARGCPQCSSKGSLDRKCTFQGWENVERICDFPWALQTNRVFLPTPKFRIGA